MKNPAKGKGKREKGKGTREKTLKLRSLARIAVAGNAIFWSRLRECSTISAGADSAGHTSMDKPYDLRDRSFLFACDIVAFCRIVADRGYIMSRLATELLKSGTSVGANLEEAADGQTKPDFIAKAFIALKESRETRYWLRLIAVSEKSLEARTRPLIAEASEFVAMLTTSAKTARSNPNRGQHKP